MAINVKQEPVRLFENLTDYDQLLTTKEVSVRLSVNEWTVRGWRFRGEIIPVKIGPKLVRYRWGDVVAWIKTQGV